MLHYLNCDTPWQIIGAVTGTNTPGALLEKIGISPSNLQNQKNLALFFHGYHAVKKIRRENPNSLNINHEWQKRNVES